MSTILIGDGNSSFLRWLEEMLFTEDYQIEATESVNKLIQKLLCKKFESLVLGTNIKGMDGLEVIPIVKQIDKDLPIIVIAHCGSLETEKKARMQNILYYLVKPFHPEEMKEVLRVAVGKQRRERFFRPFNSSIDAIRN
jgi:two-component system nitrogen regulation response regulator NtrX